MIKKETIETLKEISCSMCDYGAPNMDLCDISKCDTRDAIKALEQEPSERKAEDCISREEFIEFMISAWEEMSGDDAMQMCIDKAR